MQGLEIVYAHAQSSMLDSGNITSIDFKECLYMCVRSLPNLEACIPSRYEYRRAALVAVLLVCISAAKPMPSATHSRKKVLLLR